MHETKQEATGGIVGITARTGAVLQISVNEATLVPYVVNTLRDSALAIQLAARLNLPGADDLYMSEFNRMLSANDVAAAARLAGESPNGEREPFVVWVVGGCGCMCVRVWVWIWICFCVPVSCVLCLYVCVCVRAFVRVFFFIFQLLFFESTAQTG